jgi:membrane fusion protein, multidrug efflux system
MRLPGKVEILQGLSRGDVVVTAGQTRLLRPEPVPVKVVNIDRPARPASAPASGAVSGGRPAGMAPA